MKYLWLDKYLMSKKAVCKDYKAEWNWDRYMIDGKLFAAVCCDDATQKAKYLTFKLSPDEGEFIRSLYDDIVPGYYMNKSNWNSLIMEGNVPDELVREMLDKSYGPVLGPFSKKKQAELLK